MIGAQHRKRKNVEISLVWLMLMSVPDIFPALAAQKTASALVGQRPPAFSRVALSHKKVALVSYREKVVLLNFWATWCGTCLTEMPTFVQWQEQYGSDRFQVVGISMDDATPDVIAMASKLKLNYPVVMGDEHLGAAYGVLGVPVTFLIDPKGMIRARFQGTTDMSRIRKAIEEILPAR